MTSQLSSESNLKEDLGRERIQSSGSSQASPLRLSPAPEEYYKLVPITPLTPLSPNKGRRSRGDPPISWHVPETSTSRNRDVVQTLATSYREPRVVATARLGLPVAPSSGRIGYRPPTTGPSVPSRIASRSVQQKSKLSVHMYKKRKRKTLRRTVSSPLPRDSGDVSTTRPRKMEVRLEPEGRAAPEDGLRAKPKHVKVKKSLYKSKMKTAAKSYKSHSSLEELDTLALLPEKTSPNLKQDDTQSQEFLSAREQEVFQTGLELPEISVESSVESFSTEEFRTPFSSPIGKRDRSPTESFEKVQSEPALSPEHEDNEEVRPRAFSLTTDIFKTKEDQDSSS